eukprot:252159-Amphidinium_carterae.1
MEPTAAEAETMHSIADIAAWVPMDPAVLASLCNHLGFDVAQHYRALGFMEAQWYSFVCETWKFDGGDPSPAAFSQAGVLGRTARVLCGMERSIYERSRALEGGEEMQETLRELKRKVEAGGSGAKRIKLSQVLEQGNDVEVGYMTQQELKTAFGRFAQLMGSVPSEDEEATAEQLSTLKHVLDQDLPPYTDFA